MLQVLLGEDQRAIRDEMIQRACCAAEKGVTGQILIVPEQYSHKTERRLCEVGGDGICLSAEVLSFTRLSDRICNLYGGASRKMLDKGGRLLAMSLTLEQVSSQLKLFGTSRTKPELLLRILTVIEELKNACIGVEQLQKVAGLLSGQLAEKIKELSLLLESFDAVCQSMGQNAADRLTTLREQLELHPFLADKTIYLFGFSDFTGQELEIIAEMVSQAKGVFVGLLGDGVSQSGPYALCTETLQRLKRQAVRAEIPCKISRLTAETAVKDELQFLRKHLFTGGNLTWNQAANGLTLHHSEGIYNACMDVAGKIQNLALHGWRYRDMAICCTMPDQYQPVLEAVLSRFDIPAYFSGTEPMENDPIIRMALSALAAATNGLELETVLRFLKSGLSPLQQGECDVLENYARTWRVHGRKWESDWDMHPDGYGKTLDDSVKAQLDILNQYRIRGVGPLIELRNDLQNAANTGEQVCAFYMFLERIGLQETLETLEQQCATEAELQQAQVYNQMYETIIDALEQLHTVLGQTVRDVDDFSRMFLVLISQYTVGTIPATLDSVDVGSLQAMRFETPRALFLLGADEGVFPAYQTEHNLLNDQERKQLLTLGLGISLGQSENLDKELICIYQVLTSCTEYLYVNSCTEEPSYLFTRMKALFPSAEIEEDAGIPEILFYQAASFAETLAGLPEQERSCFMTSTIREHTNEILEGVNHNTGVLSQEMLHQLYGRKLYLSASRIDQYAACRCAYFLRYGLKLKPLKEATYEPTVYGTFVHAILEQTARQVMAEGGFSKVTEARLEEIAREKIAAYQDDTLQMMCERSERMNYLYRRNLQEVLDVVLDLGREMRVSDFRPAGFEVEFSANGLMKPIQVAGEKADAEVSGFVDRVDLYHHNGTAYVRVVDYKTGKKAFDYTDVANGMGLQMLIYLFALERNGKDAFGEKLQPAGVLYFPARRVLLSATSKLSEEEAALKRQSELMRKGLVADDEIVLHAMEHFEHTPAYLPCKVNAKGEMTGDLIDHDQMQQLRLHVSSVLSQITDSIMDGAVAPNPIVRGTDHSACSYCEYAEFCHLASGEVRMRPMRKIDRKQFWDTLGQEGKHG